MTTTTVKKTTQKEMIRQHLEAGKSITPLQALTMFNCMSLAQRVKELKTGGMCIYKELVQDSNSHKRFASYKLLTPQGHEASRN